MEKMQEKEMKDIMVGANPFRVDCVCLLLDEGWDLISADNFCRSVLGL